MLVSCRDLSGVALAVLTVLGQCTVSHGNELPTTDGFYGIWYSNTNQNDQYVYKYSGGLSTYPQQTAPIAFYSEDVNRTYFIYGGTDLSTNNSLKNYLSYFDHDTGLLARPRQVRHIGGSNNHRNATLAIDDDGYLWVFGNSHGNRGSGDLFRSANPHDITSMIDVGLPGSIFNNNEGDVKLAYSSPIYVPGQGMLVTYNQYHDGRSVHAASATVSEGEIDWNDNKRLIKISGQYQTARRNGDTVGVIANYHPGGLNRRTNLYYLQTSDLSETWTTVDGTPIPSTLTTAINPALVHEYQAEQRLVYMRDINWDSEGNPILMYTTVDDSDRQGHLSGPRPGERTVHVAHWSGSQWQIHDVLQTKHNYSHGELYVEPDGTWRVIGAFLDGPQVYGTGGEIGVWTSQDQGANWQLVNQLTQNSEFNHTYVRRPVNAHDNFYALWADGNAFAPSASRLYFTTKEGQVYRMPTGFTGDYAAPELMSFDPTPQTSAYEGFAYPANGLVGQNGGAGWSGPWQYSSVGDQGEFSVLVNSISSPAYPVATTGGSVRVAGPGTGGSNNVRIDRYLETPFDLNQDGVLYASFLLRKDVSNPGSNNNMEFDLISEAGGNVVRVGSTSNDQWFVNVANDAFGTVTVGETYFLVLRLEASAFGDNIRSVMIFDSSQTVPQNEPADWDFSNSFSSSATIGGVRLWIGRFAAGVFDEIRLGTTWDSVTTDLPSIPGTMLGDFDGDGVVDGHDFLKWQRELGTNYESSDLGDWEEDFGHNENDSSSTSKVPEPTSAGMMITAGLVAMVRRSTSIGVHDEQLCNPFGLSWDADLIEGHFARHRLVPSHAAPHIQL